MRICDEVFLLLTRDDGKVEGWGTPRGYGVRAAAVVDLALAERVTFSDADDPRVEVASDVPLGDPVLDPLLERLAAKKPKAFSAVVSDGTPDVEQLVAESLAEHGIVSIERKKMLGMVPARYPALDPIPEQQIRQRLRTVLAGAEAGVADATDLGVLQGLDVLRPVLEDESGGMTKKELAARVDELTSGDPAGEAVGRALRAIAAVVAATVAISAATTSATSSGT